MKRIILFLMAFFVLATTTNNAQGVLKKVGKAMQDELLGTKSSSSAKKTDQPAPNCACYQA